MFPPTTLHQVFTGYSCCPVQSISLFHTFSVLPLRQPVDAVCTRPPCVTVTTTSYGSSDRSSDRCHLTPSRRWSSRSFHVAWTTATQQLWRQMFCCCRSKTVDSLPAHLRQTDINFEQFKRLPKTFLFRC